jgi:hypothetical protein
VSGVVVGVGVAGSSVGVGTVGTGDGVPVWSGKPDDGPGDASTEDEVGWLRQITSCGPAEATAWFSSLAGTLLVHARGLAASTLVSAVGWLGARSWARSVREPGNVWGEADAVRIAATGRAHATTVTHTDLGLCLTTIVVPRYAPTR